MKKRLKSLTSAAMILTEGIDWPMRDTPQTPERGSRIARLCNQLDFEIDGAKISPANLGRSGSNKVED